MYLYPPKAKRVSRIGYYRGLLFLDVEDVEGNKFIDIYNVPEDLFDTLMGMGDKTSYYQNQIRHTHPTYHKADGTQPQLWFKV